MYDEISMPLKMWKEHWKGISFLNQHDIRCNTFEIYALIFMQSNHLWFMRIALIIIYNNQK